MLPPCRMSRLMPTVAHPEKLSFQIFFSRLRASNCRPALDPPPHSHWEPAIGPSLADRHWPSGQNSMHWSPQATT